MSKDAQGLIAGIERLLRVADETNQSNVAIHLNEALIEAGLPGIPSPGAVLDAVPPADFTHH